MQSKVGGNGGSSGFVDDGTLWVDALTSPNVLFNTTYKCQTGSDEDDYDLLSVSSNGDFYYYFGDGTIETDNAGIKEGIYNGMVTVTSDSITLDLGDVKMEFIFIKETEGGVE